ncbi:MAG: proteasome subunit alpha [Nitrospiria bacterium]
MSMPYYVSPEQMMQDKAEYAKKGISRGRSTVAIEYDEGILLLADNSSSLHKISEVYDRIGFAGAGKYSEFENLRKAGIRHADMKGYLYSREDVAARSLADAYSQTLGSIFSQENKPLEVEILVVEVGDATKKNEIYRIQFDGSIFDEKDFTVIGGKSEQLSEAIKSRYQKTDLKVVLKICVEAMEEGYEQTVDPNRLEAAVLDKNRKGRRFRRLTPKALAEYIA